MPSQASYEELDRSIDVMIADPDTNLSSIDPELAGLMSLAADLRHLPRPEFRADLRTALVGQVFLSATPVARPISTRSTEQLLPTLFGGGSGTYRMQRSNFLASALIHTAAIALIATSGIWLAKHQQSMKFEHISLVQPDLSEIYTVSKTTTGGGGGGGDRDHVAAPKGKLPMTSDRQITPPAIVIRNEMPKLVVAPTVVAPQINMAANMPNLGDPMSQVANLASNGTGSGRGIGSGSGGGAGSGRGIGSGSGGGAGSGRGPGVGPGWGGGIGGGPYRVGGGVSAPRVLYSPDPSYSEEARKAKFQGTVVLWTVIGPDGRVHDTKVARSLGMGLDQQAIEAVRQWRFEPSMMDGHPVAVQINIEVNFRLY